MRFVPYTEPKPRPLVTERVLRDSSFRRGDAYYPKDGLRVRNNNSYSDEDKAKAIVVCKLLGSQNKAEAILSIPQQTMSDWVNGRHISDEVRTLAKHFSEQVSEGLEQILKLSFEQTISSLTSGSMNDRERNWLLINGVDKWMVMNGMANQIVRDTTMSDEDKRSKLQEWADKLKDTGGGA